MGVRGVGWSYIPCVSAPDTDQFQQRSWRILTLRSKPANLGHKIKTIQSKNIYRVVGKKPKKLKTEQAQKPYQSLKDPVKGQSEGEKGNPK